MLILMIKRKKEEKLSTLNIYANQMPIGSFIVCLPLTYWENIFVLELWVIFVLHSYYIFNSVEVEIDRKINYIWFTQLISFDVDVLYHLWKEIITINKHLNTYVEINKTAIKIDYWTVLLPINKTRMKRILMAWLCGQERCFKFNILHWMRYFVWFSDYLNIIFALI